MPREKISKKTPKFIVVTGGVLSGLGKGLFTASLGKLLQSRGFSVIPIKIDPYLNADAGTMNPVEHGEVFVLDDGGEVDMDLGTYERFLDKDLASESNITTGKIYKKVIDKERQGDYLGKTVQLIPHITDELQEWFKRVAKRNDVEIVLIEVGGTVGDIENLIFLEGLRQLSLKEDVAFVHVTLVPQLRSVGEQKTKPSQQSVMKLREIGIQPQFIFARSETPLHKKTIDKLSLFTGVPKDDIIGGHDLANIYELPLHLEEQHVSEKIMDVLGMPKGKRDMTEWRELVSRMNNAKKNVKIAITGKYTALHDSYVSIEQALKHVSAKLGCKVELVWIETTDIEEGEVSTKKALSQVDGIIVPGGFGSRGTEGKIECIKYARENNIPFLGLCLGFQLASIEFARNVAGLDKANSTEISPKTPHPVIDILPEQRKVYKKGGTMRLGGHDVIVKPGSVASKLYESGHVRKRFRHRYEFNPKYINALESKGLVFSGHDKSGKIMQILELPGHKFFFATQFHPELTSKMLSPSPAFYGLIKACIY